MKRLALLIICCFFTAPLWGQVVLTASVDKTDLTLDDELTLTVQVSGVSGNMVMPQLPSLPAFNVYSRSAAQSTTNGHTTLAFIYTLLPRVAGKTTIGEITFNYRGKTYRTTPITVRVYRTQVPAGSSTSQTVSSNQAQNALEQLPPLERELATRAYAHAKDPFFVVAAVSNKKPYVNEPFTLAVRFYYSQPFYDARYQNPEVAGLFIEELPGTQGRQTVQGTIYEYEEKRYSLSAVSAGPVRVGGAVVTLRPGASPLSVLDRFFGGSAVEPEKTFSSKPLKFSVQPLPDQGKPASFYGAVGSGYTFSAQLDRPQTEANDAVTWSATVQGPANLKATADLRFPQPEGFAVYPSAPQTGELSQKPGHIYKTFRAEVVPAAPGTYTLPALAWSYFDPKTASYKTLLTHPLSLDVIPASRAANQVNFGQEAAQEGIQTLAQDIRYVLTRPQEELSFWERLPAWKWAHILVFTWLAVCLFIACVGKKTAAKHHAYAHAKAQLKKAATYEQLSDALSAYLLAKFRISTASLPLKDIVQALGKCRVPADTCTQFTTLWKELESARFAPSSSAQDLLNALKERAVMLLKNLEDSK